MSIVIKWSRRASKQFDDAVTYIQNDSPVNAEKFRNDILNQIDVLQKYPEKNPHDKNTKQTMMEVSEHLNCIVTKFLTGIGKTKYAL